MVLILLDNSIKFVKFTTLKCFGIKIGSNYIFNEFASCSDILCLLLIAIYFKGQIKLYPTFST